MSNPSAFDLSSLRRPTSGGDDAPARRNLSARLCQWIEEELDVLNFDGVYDLCPVLHPQQGVMHMLAFSTKGAILNTIITASAILPGAHGLTKDTMADIVRQLANDIWTQRDEQLKTPLNPVG